MLLCIFWTRFEFRVPEMLSGKQKAKCVLLPPVMFVFVSANVGDRSLCRWLAKTKAKPTE